MSNLEIYIIKKYGRWVSFKDASTELLFDIQEAVGCVIKKTGTINRQREEYVSSGKVSLSRTYKKRDYKYCVSVMDSLATRGDTVRYDELAKLLDLNMHLGVE